MREFTHSVQRRLGLVFAVLAVVVYGLAAWGIGSWQATPSRQSISPTSDPVMMLYSTYLPIIYSNSLTTKKGVANTYGACGAVKAVGAQYQYGWGPTPADCGPGVEDIPMVWGREYWEGIKSGQYLIGGDSPYLLGFNEPDLVGGQANLTPQEAAILWREIEEWIPQHAPQIRYFVSPAPSHLHPEWLEQWRDAYIQEYCQCNGCICADGGVSHKDGCGPQVDVVAIHCYGKLWNCQSTFEQAIAYCDAWPGCREVWVTEFGHWGGLDYIPESIELIEWLNAQDEIRRFFWFTSWIKNDGSEWWWGGPQPITPALALYGTADLTVFGRMYLERE